MSVGAEWKFNFEPGQTPPGYTAITTQTRYESSQGYGFLGAPPAPADTASSDTRVSIFAVDVEEGNYDVSLRFGDPTSATSTTIKAESRRLMLEKVATAPGKYETRTFTVNVRKPPITSGGAVQLNGRELGPPPVADWDEHLTLEFNGDHPGVASLEVKPAHDAVTIFIGGDSTVTDQAREPWAGWGQMLPRFFQAGVAISNQAESGLALFSFEHQKRLEKILSMMKKGDYLFIQFGHNDQKDKRPGAGPFTTYKADLEKFVDAVRGKDGIPVLITPMERRRFDNDGNLAPTLKAYAEAMQQVGAEKNTPVIDLNAMSAKFYTALGAENSTKAFVHYPANTFPGQTSPLKDDTHHNAYGAYELARCVVEGLRANVPALEAYLTKDCREFDPAHPDAPEVINIPFSPLANGVEKPAGN